MSPYRIADAARISPYPRTNPILEQERWPLSSVNSASASMGGSPSKARLMAEAAAAASSASERQTRTGERPVMGNGRQGQTEERFNVGAPKNPKNFLRRNWRGRSSRPVLEGIDEGVPSYPPPTFQEAMGIIPSPSSSTLAQSSSSASANLETDPPPTTEHHQSESETSISHASPTDTPSTSQSEESLEIISPQPGDQRIKFPPCLVSSPRSLSSTDSSISPSFDSLLTRGRTKSKMASILDMNDPDEDIDHNHELEPGLVRTSTKKRFLSLSPLRTLFPPKQHQALQNRALSAHPPGTSPYSTSRSVHFFRSTTSLASASVLRFPSFGASSLTLSGNNNRQPDDVKVMSGKSGRKFLPSTDRGKGMQRLNEDEVSDNESFESWEVLGHDGEIESRRIENEPRNLMAMIVSTSDSLPPEVISSEVSPTRSLSFTYDTPPAPTILSSIDPTPVTTDLPKSSTQTTSSQTEPHPLSLRDKKVQEAIQPLLNRQSKRVRGSNRKSKTNIAPSTISVSPLSLPGGGPPVTRVRTKMNQVVNSNQDEQQQTTPIVVNNSVDMVASKSEEHYEDQDISAAEKGPMVVKNTQEFQKALDTPLPLSPINSSSPFTLSNASILPPISLASTSPPVITSISSSKVSVAIRDDVILGGDGRGEVCRQSKTPAPGVEMLDTHMQEPETVDCVWKHHSTLRKALVTSSSAINSSSQRSPSPATSPPIRIKQHFDATPVMSSTSRASHRRHYQGRPLPRIPSQTALSTPSGNAVVDSIYAGHETYPSSRRPNTPMVPEGLLIDLEHDGPDMSGAWTPPRSYQMNISSAPMTPQPDRPVSLLMSSPDHSARFLFPSSSTNVSSFGSLSEMTDLEIIAATLGERNHNSDRDADNETLLLISEFLGPADAAGVSNVNMGSNANADGSNVSLTGRVEVQRGRITTDGRIKLKMSMFGAPVSQRKICISQLKEDQHGSMSLSVATFSTKIV